MLKRTSPFAAVLLLLWGIGLAGWGAPAGLTVTLPDTGTYAYWVQAKTGAVSILPATVASKKALTLAKPVAPGDTLFVLDAHTGQIAAHPVTTTDSKGITLTVADFRPVTSALPAASPSTIVPASPAPPDTGAHGLGRLVTLVLGLAVAVGVGWVIWRLIQTRGAPLIALLRRFNVDVPDPTPLDADADTPAPVYTPPAPRPVEKIPDEAGAPPPIPAGSGRARRGTGISLSDVPQLVGLQGLAAGSTFALTDKEVTIGRDGDNEIVLAENTVSRHHAQLRRDRAGQITLTDQGSANGVYVNGMRVENAVLQPGDEIKIGDNYFRFEA